MSGVRGFVRRHRLWAAFLAAFLPLLVLLGLQYTWLVKLERASAIAHQASLDNFLEAVATEVKWFYASNAEKALNLPPSIFTQHRCDLAAQYFRKRNVAGAQRLFTVNLSGDAPGELSVWDPVGGRTVWPSAAEKRAISLAVAPWKVLAQKDVPVDAVTLLVENRDSAVRMLLLPVTDVRSRVVGLAGMVVDLEHFRRVVLPGAIDRVLPASLDEREARDNLVVTVRDARGELVFACTDAPAGPDEVSRPLPLVFSDWRLGLRSRFVTPEQWARANFGMNLTLAVLIAAVLTAGMALALRTASREMKLSQMKSDFVSNVSHELRTPLSSIRVFAELLKHGKARTPERVRAYGEYIEDESRRLTRLIDNILDFARIESGRKTYHVEDADLGELVAEFVRTFQVRESHTGFSIALEAADDPLPVRVDPTAVGQAVHNLLDNAVKFSADSRRVEVRVGREGTEAVLSVRDWGVGIPPDERDKVFERFHRVGTGLVHDVKGSGLGLAIVSHVVRAHRGRVTLDSEPGRGSTFTVRLPLDAGAGARASAAVGRAVQA